MIGGGAEVVPIEFVTCSSSVTSACGGSITLRFSELTIGLVHVTGALQNKTAARVSSCGRLKLWLFAVLTATVNGALIAMHCEAVGLRDGGAGNKRKSDSNSSESAGHDHLLFFDLNFAATAAHTRSYVERHGLLRALHPHLLWQHRAGLMLHPKVIL